MIYPEDTIAVEWVPLADVKWDDQPIDQATVWSYAEMMSGPRNGHLAPPVLNADRTIRDGHHRLHAHRLLGREQARCLIVTQE